MDHFFGYADGEESEHDDDTETAPRTPAFCLPGHFMPVRGKTPSVVSSASAGSESEAPKETTKSHASPQYPRQSSLNLVLIARHGLVQDCLRNSNLSDQLILTSMDVQ